MNIRAEIERAISNRTIDHPKEEKVREFEAGDYNPKFAFVVRDSQLECVWVGNLQEESRGHKEELPIITMSNSRLKGGFTPKGWSQLAEWILPHLEPVTESFLKT